VSDHLCAAHRVLHRAGVERISSALPSDFAACLEVVVTVLEAESGPDGIGCCSPLVLVNHPALLC